MNYFARLAVMTSLLALPAAAGAQTPNAFVIPFAGGTFGAGALAKDGAATVGLAAGWLGPRWGLEGELADSAEFFQQDGFRTERRVTTVMGGGLHRIPMAPDSALGVYVAGGFGMLRPRLSEAGDLAKVDVTRPAFNVGGALTWMKGAVGIRGDVRYIRGLGDESEDANAFGLEVSKLHFVRTTIGLVVGF